MPQPRLSASNHGARALAQPPREIIARMLANVLVDMLVGAVPVVGDLADIWFRANQRNVTLLREYLGDEAREIIDVTPAPVRS